MSRFKKGFIAVSAVMLLSMSIFAFLLGQSLSTALYAEAVNKKEMRIQADLDRVACKHLLTLAMAKDYFMRFSNYETDMDSDYCLY